MNQRHGMVDALRGLALLGILVVNLEFIASTIDRGWDGYDAPLDLAARWLAITLFQLKAYLVFALLFGYGLTIMLDRAGGAALTARYLRRLGLLLVLGLLHAVFLFVGDILVTYALLGVTLLAFRRTPTRRLLRIAAWAYAAGVALVALVAVAIATGDAGAASPGAQEVYAEGSFLEVAARRLEELPVALSILGVLNWASTFGAFLVGMALGRTDILSRPERHVAAARRVARWCLPAGFGLAAVAASLAVAAPDRAGGGLAGAALLMETIAGPIAVAGVVAGLVAAGGRRWWGRVEAAATPAGRSSLTIYLAESAIASLIFAGYGLGLFGDVGPAAALGLAVAIWLALDLAARWWLRRFRQGPAEWLLRTVTYWRRQPLRRTAEAPS